MKVSFKSLAQLILGTSVGICLFSSLKVQPSQAGPAPTPTQQVDPLQDLRNSDRSSDPFSQAGQGDNFGLMDLMRNAIKNSNRSADGFSPASQDENLDSATAQFRAKQQQLILQQHGQSAPSASSAVKPR